MVYLFRNLRRTLTARSGLGWTLLFLGGAGLYGGLAPYLIAEGLPPPRVAANIGLALELIGLGTIAYGVGHLQDYFNRDPWWTNWKRAWKEVLVDIWARPEPQVFQLESSRISPSMGGVSMTARKPRPDGLPDRVARLEGEVNELRSSLTKLNNKQDQLHAETREEIKAVHRDVRKAKRTLERKLEQAVLPELDIEGAGLTCLFIGAILTSQPWDGRLGEAVLRILGL